MGLALKDQTFRLDSPVPKAGEKACSAVSPVLLREQP